MSAALQAIETVALIAFALVVIAVVFSRRK
jgi:hypothetical protein